MRKRGAVVLALIALCALLCLCETSPASVATSVAINTGTSGEIETSGATGSVSMTIQNNFSHPFVLAEGTSLTIPVPAGHLLTDLRFESGRVTALNHVYLGFNGGSQSSTADTGPYVKPRARGVKVFTKGHKIGARGAWVYMMAVDNTSYDPPSLLRIELRPQNATGHPSGVASVTAANQTEFHDDILGWGYHYYTFPVDSKDSNTVTTTDHFLIINCSLLNGTPWGYDMITTRLYSKTGVVGEIATFGDSGWNIGNIFTFPAKLLAVRIDEDNNTWIAPTAEAVSMQLTMDGQSVNTTGDVVTVHLGEPKSTETTFALNVCANLSCDFSLEWSAIYARVKDRSEPSPEPSPAGRYPDHLDHKPYEPPQWPQNQFEAFLGIYGWYVVWLVVMLSLTIGLTIIFRFNGLILGLNIILYVEIIWIVCFWHLPAVLTITIRDQDAVISYIIWFYQRYIIGV